LVWFPNSVTEHCISDKIRNPLQGAKPFVFARKIPEADLPHTANIGA